MTVQATLTPTGFDSDLQLDKALDQAAVDVFVSEGLIPTLRPGDIVLLDNRSVHKSARTGRRWKRLAPDWGSSCRRIPWTST